MDLEELGICEQCSMFSFIAWGVWPMELDVPHVSTLGLVGLQHRYVGWSRSGTETIATHGPPLLKAGAAVGTALSTESLETKG
uniref:Uncharacterized protein n=1 Tax=Crocodylus porosus TaxID=8502 RepID=A0A7M4F9J1_CROPO